mgnify:CR=1 FL=1
MIKPEHELNFRSNNLANATKIFVKRVQNQLNTEVIDNFDHDKNLLLEYSELLTNLNGTPQYDEVIDLVKKMNEDCKKLKNLKQ